MHILSSNLSKLVRPLIKAGLIVSLYFIVGCSTPPQTLKLTEQPPTNIALSADIDNVPFYSQQAYYCGPTTLAEVFEYNGIKKSPESIAPLLFIPKRQGSLQLEMVAAIRQQGFLAYSSRGSLIKLIELINQNIPVVVLQNLGLSWYPLWHYAVVKGYDLHSQEFILHSADIKNRRVSMAVFERTWQRANFWFVSALTPKQSTTLLDDFTYISAAQDLISTGKGLAAIEYLHIATDAWPDNWLSYFLLANYYLAQSGNTNNNSNDEDLTHALYWFEQGIAYGQNQSHYLNNYAYALFKKGDIKQAIIQIKKALIISPNDSTIVATEQEILASVES